MYVRGSNDAVEYKRDDRSFYKGIVVKNNDPLNLHRVKIFIPELSNQPLEGWLQEYERMNMRFPGRNNLEDVWSDTSIYEEIAAFLPWAEQCSPLFGEASPGRYQSSTKVATITDSNYEDQFEINDEEPPTIEKGSFGPSFLWENYDTIVRDAFANPTSNYAKQCNPYAYMYTPSSNANTPKGIFSVPSVGSKMWVFLYNGDPNFPVYIGSRNDYRGQVLINNMDNKEELTLDYPGSFENKQ